MRNRNWFRLAPAIILACLGLGTFAAWGQTTSTGGSLNVVVTDPSGAAIPGANLELKDLSTNDIRRGATQASGIYTFPNLPKGTYQLTATAQGFNAQIFESVEVRTSLETSVKAALKIGVTSESVTVTASETPLVQTEASTLSTSIDTKQVFNLPVIGRSAFALSFLTPGWASPNSQGNSTGTFNNMPGGAIVSADFDGTAGISNRFRSSGYNAYGTVVVQPRIENIAEMTISTAQLDLSGNGTSAMRISIVNKRGSNQFHGRLYEDFRNTALNANSWSGNANGNPRSITKFNEFGGNVGGPIVKNKLFFFGTWAETKNPHTLLFTTSVLNPSAQQGNFQYLDNAGKLQSVNLFQIATAAGLPSKLAPTISSQLSAINGVLGQGNLVQSTSDPNISNDTFTQAGSNTIYYPTVRLDYNKTEKLRFNVSYTQQKQSEPKAYGTPNFPGLDDIDRVSYNTNNKIAGVGVDYSITPRLFNQFHAGYLYQFQIFDPENLGLDLPSLYHQNWAYGTSVYAGGYPKTTISSLYSMYSLNDTVSWQRGQHAFVFGGSGFREWDRYWNGPGGWPSYTFGLVSTDPAYTALNNAMPTLSTTLQGSARALYATLVARISAINIAVGRPLDPATKQYKPYGQYNLNEVQQSGGFWFQDRWRLAPNLTMNYGLRWDIIGDDYDKDGAYTSAKSLADVWGPTTLGSMFQPGALNGVAVPSFVARQHVYNTMWKNPQPAIAFAWNPQAENGILGKLLGHNKTVIRTGYSIRTYQEGAQNFWAFASNGQFFYQGGSANPDPTQVGPGYFKPGSLTFGDPLPGYVLTPTTYAQTIPATNNFPSTYVNINPNIRAPYIQQWNFGIQRELPGGNALEVNYVGNLALHSWLGLNLNEVNIFENGFLTEFQNAQSNMAINAANGKGNTPFNFGLPGQVALPIMTAAFGNTNNSNWTGTATNLQTGAVGSQARTMVSTTSYLCSVVNNANFAPCAGAATLGKPLNFWNINPWAKTSGLNYLDSAGMSDYHALQVQLRQRYTHGMQFQMSYTLAKSLNNGAVNNIQSQGYTPYTLRNLNLNYGPSPYDIRQVFHLSGTYDLPFGKGKAFLRSGGALNAIVGNWILGTITTIQAGNPTMLSGNYATVTGTTSGINLNGMTGNQLQSMIKIQSTGLNYKYFLDPSLIAANGMANSNLLTPVTTPGVFGAYPVLRAPMWWQSDLSATKSVVIHENYRFTLQVTAANAFNHPTISSLGTLGLLSTSFGRVTPGGTPRNLELRANIEF